MMNRVGEETMSHSLIFIPVLALAWAVPAMAQQKSDVPKAGSLKLHSGWKSIQEDIKVTESRSVAAGHVWGVTYNDEGSGPLHMGSVVCPFVNEGIEGEFTYQGKCAWSDTDGDKIFTDWTGKANSAGFIGLNIITGGSGKFSGIQGKAP